MAFGRRSINKVTTRRRVASTRKAEEETTMLNVHSCEFCSFTSLFTGKGRKTPRVVVLCVSSS